MLGVRADACDADQLTYLLPLTLGQNDFDVFITSNASSQAAWVGFLLVAWTHSSLDRIPP